MPELSKIGCWVLLASSIAAAAHGQAIRHRGCVVDLEIWALPQCALETKDGHLYVSQRYLRLFFHSEKRELFARVIPDGGWAYFNRTGLIVVQDVVEFDNYADDFHDGLVRVARKGKWGLANAHGEMIVPLVYDAIGFPDERANRWSVCLGCSEVVEGEHRYWEGGVWYWLDEHYQLGEKAEVPVKPAAKMADK